MIVILHLQTETLNSTRDLYHHQFSSFCLHKHHTMCSVLFIMWFPWMWISGPLFAVKTCGGMLSDSKGVFTSPLHPSFYPPAVDCKWTIKVCIPALFTGPLLYLKPHPSSSSSSLACHEQNAEAALWQPNCSVPLLSSSVRTLLLLQLRLSCGVLCVGFACVRACTHSLVWVCCCLSSFIYMWYR